jgi:signal transduction histidine kinase
VADVFYNTGFNADTLLFTETINNHLMGTSVAISFLCMSTAVLIALFDSKIKEYLFQSLVVIALSISAVYLCANLFRYGSLHYEFLSPMSFNTSFCIVLVATGMLYTFSNRGYMGAIMSSKLGGVLARKIVPLLILTQIFVGGLRVWGKDLNLYNTELGVSLHVVLTSVITFIMGYYFSNILNTIDTSRKKNEDELEKKSKQLLESELLLERTAYITKVGGWEITLPENKVSYTKELYRIREMDEDAEVDFRDSMNAYTPESAKEMLKYYHQALKDGKPYSLEAKLITSKQREIWVKVIGHPVIDEWGNITGIRGTLQDIDESKKKEILLQQSMEIIHDQNNRLMNFTHIVSHNLRNHAANIKSSLSLYANEESEQEKDLILKVTNKAADSLNHTIADLSEIVAVQSASKQLKTNLHFTDVLRTAKEVLMKQIIESNANITTDFSACNTINYVPAYLESIFHNFVSNAVKYRRPDVRPEIRVVSSVEDGKVTVSFSDNGLGIDLEKYKEKLFGMYKTFHRHPDATGVGLYLTKNQVESLGGSIEVYSEVNVGTTFKVIF